MFLGWNLVPLSIKPLPSLQSFLQMQTAPASPVRPWTCGRRAPLLPHWLQKPGLPQCLNGIEPLCNAEFAGDMGSIPGLGKSPGEGHGNLLWYSCLENPMDREPGGLHDWETEHTHTHTHRQNPKAIGMVYMALHSPFLIYNFNVPTTPTHVTVQFYQTNNCLTSPCVYVPSSLSFFFLAKNIVPLCCYSLGTFLPILLYLISSAVSQIQRAAPPP